MVRSGTMRRSCEYYLTLARHGVTVLTLARLACKNFISFQYERWFDPIDTMESQLLETSLTSWLVQTDATRIYRP